MDSKRFDVEVSGFQSYTFEPEDCFLRGSGTLTSRNLSLRTQAGDGLLQEATKQHINTLEVFVYPRPQTSAKLHVEVGGGTPDATLSLYLGSQQFSLLVERPGALFRFSFTASNDDLSLEKGPCIADAHIVNVSATEYFNTGPVNHYRRFDEELPSLVASPYSQLGRIARELLQSLDDGMRSNLIDTDSKASCRASIDQIISALRQGTPRAANDAIILAEPPVEFTKALKELDKNEASRLSDLYDNVWHHNTSARVIESGKFEQKDTGEILTDVVEQVAHEYLSSPFLVSPSLEWLLIDALLFNETVAFARSIAWLPPIQPWAQVRYHLLRGSWRWISEAITLALTFILAEFVDSTRGIGFWAVAATITLARWLRPNVPIKERTRILQLLSDMSSAQSLLAAADFNSRMLRQRLYALSNRGAEFRQVTYSMLDKRISRESAIQRSMDRHLS